MGNKSSTFGVVLDDITSKKRENVRKGMITLSKELSSPTPQFLAAVDWSRLFGALGKVYTTYCFQPPEELIRAENHDHNNNDNAMPATSTTQNPNSKAGKEAAKKLEMDIRTVDEICIACAQIVPIIGNMPPSITTTNGFRDLFVSRVLSPILCILFNRATKQQLKVLFVRSLQLLDQNFLEVHWYKLLNKLCQYVVRSWNDTDGINAQATPKQQQERIDSLVVLLEECRKFAEFSASTTNFLFLTLLKYEQRIDCVELTLSELCEYSQPLSSSSSSASAPSAPPSSPRRSPATDLDGLLQSNIDSSRRFSEKFVVDVSACLLQIVLSSLDNLEYKRICLLCFRCLKNFVSNRSFIQNYSLLVAIMDVFNQSNALSSDELTETGAPPADQYLECKEACLECLLLFVKSKTATLNNFAEQISKILLTIIMGYMTPYAHEFGRYMQLEDDEAIKLRYIRIFVLTLDCLQLVLPRVTSEKQKIVDALAHAAVFFRHELEEPLLECVLKLYETDKTLFVDKFWASMIFAEMPQFFGFSNLATIARFDARFPNGVNQYFVSSAPTAPFQFPTEAYDMLTTQMITFYDNDDHDNNNNNNNNKFMFYKAVAANSYHHHPPTGTSSEYSLMFRVCAPSVLQFNDSSMTVPTLSAVDKGTVASIEDLLSEVLNQQVAFVEHRLANLLTLMTLRAEDSTSLDVCFKRLDRCINKLSCSLISDVYHQSLKRTLINTYVQRHEGIDYFRREIRGLHETIARLMREQDAIAKEKAELLQQLQKMEREKESVLSSLVCAICLEFFIDKEPVCLECGHMFCGDCMEGLLHSPHAHSSNKCPSCRKPITRPPIKMMGLTSS